MVGRPGAVGLEPGGLHPASARVGEDGDGCRLGPGLLLPNDVVTPVCDLIRVLRVWLTLPEKDIRHATPVQLGGVPGPSLFATSYGALALTENYMCYKYFYNTAMV